MMEKDCDNKKRLWDSSYVNEVIGIFYFYDEISHTKKAQKTNKQLLFRYFTLRKHEKANKQLLFIKKTKTTTTNKLFPRHFYKKKKKKKRNRLFSPRCF